MDTVPTRSHRLCGSGWAGGSERETSEAAAGASKEEAAGALNKIGSLDSILSPPHDAVVKMVKNSRFGIIDGKNGLFGIIDGNFGVRFIYLRYEFCFRFDNNGRN